MSGHTPGPWWVDVHTNVICSKGLVAFPGIAAGLPEKANARLIAAAPDLLEALREMLLHFGKPRREEWMNDDAWQEAINSESRARAAIARATATGEQS